MIARASHYNVTTMHRIINEKLFDVEHINVNISIECWFFIIILYVCKKVECLNM